MFSSDSYMRDTGHRAMSDEDVYMVCCVAFLLS